jgi:hypothetical protein
MQRRDVMKGLGAMATLLPAMAAAEGEMAVSEGDVTPDTVYELRVYHLNEGKETAIFARCGMHGVAYWTPTDEPLAGRTLIYLLRHQSRAAATESWVKFRADPEWVALKAETEKDGPFVVKAESTFMRLTEFSPKV